MLQTREFRIGCDPISTGAGFCTFGRVIAGVASVGLRAAVALAGITAGGGTSIGGLMFGASGPGIGGRSGILIASSGRLTGGGRPGPLTGVGSGIRGLGMPGASGSLISGSA